MVNDSLPTSTKGILIPEWASSLCVGTCRVLLSSDLANVEQANIPASLFLPFTPISYQINQCRVSSNAHAMPSHFCVVLGASKNNRSVFETVQIKLMHVKTWK